jgi:hypothetical protein
MELAGDRTRTCSLTGKLKQWLKAQKASGDRSDSHTCQWWRCRWCWFGEAAAGPERKLAARREAMRERREPHRDSGEEEC